MASYRDGFLSMFHFNRIRFFLPIEKECSDLLLMAFSATKSLQLRYNSSTKKYENQK